MKSATPARPPVVLLHGFAQTPASWDEVVRLLQAQGRHTYVLDLYRWLDERLSDDVRGGTGRGDERGGSDEHGRSGASVGSGESAENGCASLGALCQYVADTVRQVAEVEGAPVLVGYSMGGRIVAETLVRYGFQSLHLPGQDVGKASRCRSEQSARRRVEEPSGSALPLAGLVLESAALGPADEAARAALAERNAAWAARLREEGVEPFMDWWEMLPLFASQRALPAETRAVVRAERASHSAESLAQSLEAWGAHHQAGECEAIAALAAAYGQGLPFLYIAGERDEKYAAVADRLQKTALPTAIIPNAGHNVHLENPAVIADILASGF